MNATFSTRFREVTALFSKLGITALGDSAVSEAMVHVEAIHHRKWMNDQKFLDILSVTNLIPGGGKPTAKGDTTGKTT